MRRFFSFLLFLMPLSAWDAAFLEAQTCFRGKPLPACKSFMVIESGFGVRLNPGRYSGGFADSDRLATLDVGLMRNRTSATALGATLFLGVGDQITSSTGVLLGLKPRVRRWVGRSLSLDLSPGAFLVVRGDDNQGTLGAIADASVNLGDWAAVTGQVLVGKAPGFRSSSRVGFYLGGKLGSYPGVVSAVVVPLLVLVIASGIDD